MATEAAKGNCRICTVSVTHYLAVGFDHVIAISHDVEMQNKTTLPLVLLQSLCSLLFTMLSDHISYGFINKMGFT